MNAVTSSWLGDLVDGVADHPARVAWATGVLLAILPLTATALSRRSAERRARYARMAATLTAWCELPYRIRRRTSNASTSVDSLVTHVHDLQQQLVLDRVDLRSDCGWLADVRDRAEQEIRTATAPWVAEAWNSPPISSTGDMNLGAWGPKGHDSTVDEFAREVRWRFGWRRAVSPLRRLSRRAGVPTGVPVRRPSADTPQPAKSDRPRGSPNAVPKRPHEPKIIK